MSAMLEHDLDTMIRQSIDDAWCAPDDDDASKSTARMSAFDVEDALAKGGRPTAPPAPPADERSEAVVVPSLPPPAVEVDRTRAP